MDFERHTFFITGASSGLGLAIAREALNNGHAVIGTARNIEAAAERHPEFTGDGGKWIELDVTDADAEHHVRGIIEDNDVSVLVNNAGYGLYGALEDMSESEIRAQMETNFFGGVKVLKGAIPYFRGKRRGTIVTISSISGLTVTSASGILYSASKFAMEAISEGLTLQLQPFGIRTIIVEPGLFRTNWLSGSYVTPAAGLGAEYRGSDVEKMLEGYPRIDGRQEGDPVKAAKRILEVLEGRGMGSGDGVARCLRVPLGRDALEKGRDKAERLRREYDVLEGIALSTSFSGT